MGLRREVGVLDGLERLEWAHRGLRAARRLAAQGKLAAEMVEEAVARVRLATAEYNRAVHRSFAGRRGKEIAAVLRKVDPDDVL